MNSQYKRMIIALVVLIGIATAFILYLSMPLISGKTLTLATQTVDPFDLFRGQYLTINYEIGRIPLIEDAKVGDTLSVVLNEGEGKIWHYQSAQLGKPESGVFIKGSIKSIYGSQMAVEYGIEQFFFERNAQFSTTNMTVEVKVSGAGQARISKLLVNGEPLKVEYENFSLTS